MGKDKQVVRAYQDRIDVRNNQVFEKGKPEQGSRPHRLSNTVVTVSQWKHGVHVTPDKSVEQTSAETLMGALDFDTGRIVRDWWKVCGST